MRDGRLPVADAKAGEAGEVQGIRVAGVPRADGPRLGPLQPREPGPVVPCEARVADAVHRQRAARARKQQRGDQARPGRGADGAALAPGR